MKTKGFTLILACLAIHANALNYSLLASNPKEIKWFNSNKGAYTELGFYSTTIKGISMIDFDISDHNIYGLKSANASNKESRYRVNLSNYINENINLNGFSLGMRWHYSNEVQGTIALRGAFGKHSSSFFQIGTSVSPILFTYKRFRFISEIEIGYTGSNFKVKNMQPLPDYHKHLRGENGFDLKPGDDLIFQNSDFYLQPGLTMQYAFNNSVLFYGNISFSKVLYTGKMSFYSSTSGGDHMMKSGSEHVVNTHELKSEVYNSNPNIIRTGPILTFGVSFNLRESDSQSPTCTPKKCSCCGQVIPD